MLFLLSEIATILRKAPLQQENSIRPSSKLYSVCIVYYYYDVSLSTGKMQRPIKYGVKTMNKVIVDIVNDFELKNIGCKISQPKNFV